MQKDANQEYKAYYMQWLDELSFSLLGTLNYVLLRRKSRNPEEISYQLPNLMFYRVIA